MIKKIALILPVISGAMWGSAGIFVRTLQDFGFDKYTVISSKMILTAIILFTCIAMAKKELLKVKIKDFWMFIGSGFVGMVLLNFGYNAAVEQLTLSFAAVLLSLSPVFVMCLAAVFFKEKITPKKIVCTFMAVTGCTMVSGLLEGGSLADAGAGGIILGLSAAFFYATYTLFSKALMKKGYNVFTVIFYSTLIAGVVLVPFTDWTVIGSFMEAAPVEHSVFMVVYAVGTAILPYVLYTMAMNHADAGKVAILGAGGEPSAAMIFGCIFFGEIPSLVSIAGLVITIAALTFICMPEKEEKCVAVNTGLAQNA